MTSDEPRFELDPRQDAAAAVSDAALAQLAYALAVLEHGGADAIHEARKACKRLRAMLRLIRPLLGPAYRVDNTRLRDAGRALSAGRDAAVLVQTADALLGQDDALEAIAERLRERMPRVPAASARKARDLLRIQQGRTPRWPLRGLSSARLVAGMVEGYRRSRREYEHAHRKPRPEVLHEWRKQVKYHRYQSELMAAAWPAAGARVHRLKKLSDALGEHHDLEVLDLHLRDEGRTLASRPQLRRAHALLRDEKERRAHKALKLGGKLFDDRPAEWLDEARP